MDQAPSRDSKRWSDRRSTKTGFRRKWPRDTHMSISCTGTLPGIPAWQASAHPYTVKLVEDAHRRTLHGGVGLTTARIRKRHWVPRLRLLTKREIKQCYGWHRFQVRAAAKPTLALGTVVRPDAFDNSGTAKSGGSRVPTYPWRCNCSGSTNARYCWQRASQLNTEHWLCRQFENHFVFCYRFNLQERLVWYGF